MIISILFLIITIFVFFVYGLYLREYVEVTVVFKSRDLLVLKLLPDFKKKSLSEKILNLINDRNAKSKISYDDALAADVALHNELKKLYDVINKEKKNALQEDIFKRIILMEKRIKILRSKYTAAVAKYNMSLTIHPKVCLKIFHMKPLEMYGKKE